MEMKNILIPNWKDSWSFLSVQMAALLALLDVAYEYLYVVQTYLPQHYVRWCALAIIVGRIVNQSRRQAV